MNLMLRRLSPQVLAQRVQDGGDEDLMSVELLQEQVELHLEYDAGSLSKWHNFLGRTLRDFFKSKNPASVHTALTWACKAPQPYESMTGSIGQRVLT